MKSWFENNDIEIYLTHNEGKSVVAERFLRTLKNKICKHMTALSKNVYIDKQDEIIDNTATQIITKIKPADVNSTLVIMSSIQSW